MKNGREDAAKVIWCHDVWSSLVRHRLICLMSRTRCRVVCRDGSSLHRRRILQRFFQNAGLLLWRHRGLGRCVWASFGPTLKEAVSKALREMSSTRLPRRRQPLRRHQQLLRQQQWRMVPAPPTSIPRLRPVRMLKLAPCRERRLLSQAAAAYEK